MRRPQGPSGWAPCCDHMCKWCGFEWDDETPGPVTASRPKSAPISCLHWHGCVFCEAELHIKETTRAGRRKLSSACPTVRVIFKAPLDLVESAKARARAMGMSASAAYREAIQAWIADEADVEACQSELVECERCDTACVPGPEGICRACSVA